MQHPNSPPHIIAPFTPNERFSNHRLNRLASAINRSNTGVDNPDYEFDDPVPILPRGIQKFSLVSVGTDILVANPFTDSTTIDTTTNINIMMPWTLRQTPFNGLTVNGITYTYTTAIQRSATDGVTTETQKITQDYFVGAVFYANTLDYAETVSGTVVTLIDMNTDARCWAKV